MNSYRQHIVNQPVKRISYICSSACEAKKKSESKGKMPENKVHTTPPNSLYCVPKTDYTLKKNQYTFSFSSLPRSERKYPRMKNKGIFRKVHFEERKVHFEALLCVPNAHQARHKKGGIQDSEMQGQGGFNGLIWQPRRQVPLCDRCCPGTQRALWSSASQPP